MTRKKSIKTREMAELRKSQRKKGRDILRERILAYNINGKKLLNKTNTLNLEIINSFFSGKKINCSNALKNILDPLEFVIKLKNAKDRIRRIKKLLLYLMTACPKLIDRRYMHALWLLTLVPWERLLPDWTPKGKSSETLFRSLVKHLLVVYDAPLFLYSILFSGRGEITDACVKFFAHICSGWSIFKALQKNLIPVKMTKKMCHVFYNTSSDMNIFAAIRFAQTKVSGGDKRLAQAISATVLGRSFMTDEDFWLKVIEWFCKNHMLNPEQVGPLIDYITHCKNENPDFKIKGRSILAMLRKMNEWHNELAKERKLNGISYTPSGIKEGKWEFKKRNKEGNFIITTWQIDEILTSRILAAEGRCMKHCVLSYSRYIEAQKVSIWSLKKNSERMITIEVDNRSRTIVQARGKYNRLPDSKEKDKISRWALENNVQIRLPMW